MNIELLKDKKVVIKGTNIELTYLDVIVMNTYFESVDNYEYETILNSTPIYDNEKDIRSINLGLCYEKLISEFKTKFGKKLIHITELICDEDIDWCICKGEGTDDYYGVATHLVYSNDKREYTHATCDIHKINITEWDYPLIDRAREGSTWNIYVSEKLNADTEEFWSWAEQYIKSKLELKLDLNIGYIKDGVIVTEYSNEADGNVFRSQDAFNKKEGICYVNMFENEFTYSDFLEASAGNADIAAGCFEMMICTWNFPDSYIEDGLDEGYFRECSCGFLYDHNEVDKCPKCNKLTKDLDKLEGVNCYV